MLKCGVGLRFPIADLQRRSDAAYDRAATGLGNADGYKVIETGVNGIAETGTAPQ